MLYGSGRIKNEKDLELDIIRSLRRILRRMGKREFIIYPYGYIGRLTKEVLEKEFQITPCKVLDDFCTDNKIDALDEKILEDMSEAVLLLATNSLEIYDEIRQKVAKVCQSIEVYDLFPNKPLLVNDARIIAFEMAAREIYRKGLTGAVAEVGVFRGYTASYLNIFFKDKKLYLFDTFEGFTQQDCEIEWKNGFSVFQPGSFSDTSIAQVKEKMKYPDNCYFYKGYFPETAQNINDKFCFVHLDADLFHPIYEGLKLFYPLVEKGGYIFIHDVVGSVCLGAREALERFCKEEEIGYVLMPDSIESGTAVIVKA